MKRAWIGALIAFAILFVAARLPFLLYSEYVYDEEEVKTAAIAVILLQGAKLPVMEHQHSEYEGGALAFGVLTIPFILIFKAPYLALKMLALTTTLISVLFSVLWIRKLAGDAGAVFAAVLWLFAVPYLLQMCFVIWGNYPETVMFNTVTFFLLHTILFESKQRLWRFFLLGLLFGFGLYVHYGYLVTIVVCLFFIFLSQAKLLVSKKMAVTGLGAVVGLIPWIVYNATHGFRGLEKLIGGLEKGVAEPKIVLFGRRIASLFSEDIPASLHLIIGDLSTTRLASYLYYFLFLALLIALLILSRKSLRDAVTCLAPPLQTGDRRARLAVLVPVAYFFGYAVVYSYSEYGLLFPRWGLRDVESHVHIFVMLPAVIWIGATAAGQIWEKNKAAAVAPIAVLALLGSMGQWQLLDFQTSQVPRLIVDFRAHIGSIYMEAGNKWGHSPEHLARYNQALDDYERQFFIMGAGTRFAQDKPEAMLEALDKCRAFSDRYAPYCQFGIGAGMRAARKLKPEQIDWLIETAPEAARLYLIGGIAVDAIWNLDYQHPYVIRARSLDYEAIAPHDQKEALTGFVRSHLNMTESHPKKW